MNTTRTLATIAAWIAKDYYKRNIWPPYRYSPIIPLPIKLLILSTLLYKGYGRVRMATKKTRTSHKNIRR